MGAQPSKACRRTSGGMRRRGENRSLKNGLLPVALRAPSRSPFFSEKPLRFGVFSYESTYRCRFYPPVSFLLEATRPIELSCQPSPHALLELPLHLIEGSITVVPVKATDPSSHPTIDPGDDFFGFHYRCPQPPDGVHFHYGLSVQKMPRLRLRPRGLIPDISFGREPSNSTGGTFTRLASGFPGALPSL